MAKPRATTCGDGLKHLLLAQSPLGSYKPCYNSHHAQYQCRHQQGGGNQYRHALSHCRYQCKHQCYPPCGTEYFAEVATVQLVTLAYASLTATHLDFYLFFILFHRKYLFFACKDTIFLSSITRITRIFFIFAANF